MHELISVIVPVYNVEKYLEKCVQSICQQTYQNLEIILVNDGSPDQCGLLCDELAKKDSRIKVIHKVNGGLSDARNAGIDKASGKYIMFIDSDDYINIRMIEKLHHCLTENSADMSICQFKYVYENDIVDIHEALEDGEVHVFDAPEHIENLFNERNLQTVVAWNKLYKKELWDRLRYPKGKIHEDEFVIHHLLNLCSKVVYLDMKLHYYLQRSSSIMGISYSLKRLQGVEALLERVHFYKGTPFELKARYRYLQVLIENFYLVKEHYPTRKDLLSDLVNQFNKQLKQTKGLSKSTYLRFKIFSFNQSLYQYMKKSGIIHT